MTAHDLLLALAFAVVAALYGAVGHGGASGYLAVMGLAGWTAAAMRPTALVLNLIVSLTGTILFHRGGWLRLRSGLGAAPVNQAAERLIALGIRPLA